MTTALLQALMAQSGGVAPQSGDTSPQFAQFAAGALGGGGLRGGVNNLLGGLLAQKLRQRAQQQPVNPPDQLASGIPGAGGQPPL